MDWYLIVAAVATATSIHAIMEPMALIEKLKRFEKASRTGKIDDPKIKGIDTRAKAYSLGVFVTLVATVLAYLVINAVNPSVNAALQYSVAVLVAGKLITIVQIDQYHVVIEKFTQKQGKKK